MYANTLNFVLFEQSTKGVEQMNVQYLQKKNNNKR